MATITAPSMHDRMYVGTHGNVSVAFAGALLQNVAVNDVVDLIEVPIGIKVMGVQIRSSGLGLNVKLDLALGDTPLLSQVDVATAGVQTLPCEAYTERKSVLRATITGGVANGELAVTPQYVAVGY
ncbi:hypothetical protein GCM10007932_22690 [Vibrio penaeicida]|uniref:DUF4402 domain-containing protein n=1 Tax=Vibrio penaeicida TaxID=104609 RepID=A0AAV5NQN3_9VIBR|nr:hypothetical protein GCM10007932_22690 [Vibrio penaeicida]